MADQDNAGIVPLNTRSPAQWAVLSEVIDWNRKTVLDVGCGHGDLLLYAQKAGADKIRGVDINPDVVAVARDRGVPVALSRLEDYLEYTTEHYDVAICFSVLPYLEDKSGTLERLAGIANVTFIEAQLIGDGPGCYIDEDDLRDVLLRYWPKVTRIGETKVKIRNTVRAIWMCEHVG